MKIKSFNKNKWKNNLTKNTEGENESKIIIIMIIIITIIIFNNNNNGNIKPD